MCGIATIALGIVPSPLFDLVGDVGASIPRGCSEIARLKHVAVRGR